MYHIETFRGGDGSPKVFRRDSNENLVFMLELLVLELFAARGLCQSTERQAVRKTEGVFVSLLWPCPLFCFGAFCATYFFICKLFISNKNETKTTTMP